MVLRFWKRYRPVLSTRDALVVFSTGILILVAWLLELIRFPFSWVSPAMATLAAVIGGWPIARLAWVGVRNREINADQLVIVALVASLLSGEYIAGATVAFIMIFGGLLEELTTHKMRLSISDLLDLAPTRVTLRRNGREETVELSELSIGDVVLVRSGERIPIDGHITAGNGCINEAPITGESLPVDKAVGAQVFAGTLLEAGALEIETTGIGSETVLGRIVRLTEGAERNVAPVQRLADKYARYFAPIIVLIAGLVWILSKDYHRALAVLVVACPCGFVLATPTAVMAGLANGARRGILVKGGKYLEALGKARIVAFDKTGTLTCGRPKVTDIVLVNGLDENEFVILAATAEKFSEHPLGRAIFDEGTRRGLAIPDPDFFKVHIGKGVCAKVDGRHVTIGNADLLVEHEVPTLPVWEGHAQSLTGSGKTVLSMAVDGRLRGMIALADWPRQEAHAAVAALKQQGVEQVVMLTGDSARVAAAVAKQVGIDRVYAELMPEDKVATVVGFRDTGITTVMVGDGINDAPALAAANVGIAMGAAGTDVAIETADVVLMTDDLTKVAETIALSKVVLSTIRQNIIWFAVLFNAVGILLASMGNINAVGGAMLHNIGSIAVVLNSSRLVLRKNLGARSDGGR
jgi:Cd2+/Zn2+-exporting ATPase